MADAKITLTGDATGALTAIKRLKEEMNGLKELAVKGIEFSIAGYSVAKLMELTKATIETGEELYKMSQKTGIAVEELSKLKYAADLAGVSHEALTKGLTQLAVNMVSAGTNVGPLAEEFKKLEIKVRNSDDTMKSSGTVLSELADKFKDMPDGVDKTNLAVTLFGKKLGAEMIPLLNTGAAGLKAMGDEAQSLGLVMGSELAKQSEEFNVNLDRMQKLSGALGIQIASAVIPQLNKFTTQLLDAKKAGLGYMDALVGIGLTNPFKTTEEQIVDLDNEIKKLKALNASIDPFVDEGVSDKQIAALENLKKYYELQQKRETGDGIQSAEELAAKRLSTETQLQMKLAKLDQLRAIESGKISADILDNDTKRTDKQIKNAEKLRDALRNAWDATKKEAADAGDKAKELFEKAANKRQETTDKVNEKKRSALPVEQQQVEIKDEFDKAISTAESSSLIARYAQAYGRGKSEIAVTAAKDAEKAAERASNYAEKISDPATSAAAIQRAGDVAENLLNMQGQAKLDEKKSLDERAASQATMINDLDKQITDLQTKAESIKVQADISDANAAIKELQDKLDNLAKPVTVPINFVKGGSFDSIADKTAALDGLFGGGAAGSFSFAAGGYTGDGGKFQPAGIVHANEFVTRSEVVRQPGALAFLSSFNRRGLDALKGYATGGLVSNLEIPALRANAAPGSNAVFNFPGMGSFPAQLAPQVLDDLKTAFAREALKKGGRR